MACNTCGKVSVKNDVNLKTSYEPNVASKTKMTDIIMSFKVEKKKNNNGNVDKDNNRS